MNESEFNAYISNITFFKGEMNDLANSIEIVLDLIFEKKKCKNLKNNKKDPIMLGGKITKFENCESIRDSENFDELVQKIKKFNDNWVITKHGMTVDGMKKPTICKDGVFYVFDEKKRLEISQDFSQIMKDLIEISK